jgi:hypothetical protein
MRFSKLHFPYGFFIKITRVLLKTFERRTRRHLDTTREDFKTTQKISWSTFQPRDNSSILEDFRLVELWDAQGLLAKAINTT